MSLKRLLDTEVERALSLQCSRSLLLSGDLVSLHISEIAEITGSSTSVLFKCERKAEWLLHHAKTGKIQVMILWTDHGENKKKWTDVEQDQKKSCQMFECSRHSNGHKCGTQLPYALFIPVSCFRTVKPKGFKLFTFSASKEIMHSPSNVYSRINAVLKKIFTFNAAFCFNVASEV